MTPLDQYAREIADANGECAPQHVGPEDYAHVLPILQRLRDEVLEEAARERNRPAAWRTVKCPTCLALEGQHCTLAGSRGITRPHAARSRALKATRG